MPKFSIIDTHVHLMDIKLMNYSNLKNEAPNLYKNHHLSDYILATKNINVTGIIFMELWPDHPNYITEVEWITKISWN